MARDVVVIGATVAGLTAARRLASEGFDVTVLDPSPEGVSVGIGHGVAACAHASTVANMASAYGVSSAHEHVRRNLAGMAEIRRVLAAGGVEHHTVRLQDHSLGVALARELRDVATLITDSGAQVEVREISADHRVGAWLSSEAIALDPASYGAALASQALTAGAVLRYDTTVTHLQRRDGVSLVSHRDNVAWARDLDITRGTAVVDTLGISPWGRIAQVAPSEWVPVLRCRTENPVTAVTLLAGPPVWMIRPDGDEAIILGVKNSPETYPGAAAELKRWAVATLGAHDITETRMVIDPSDHGRPAVGASAIPGGFYARGNGRGELMNGTASGAWLASLLIGSERRDVALPLSARIRAQARSLGHRMLER
ncbi:MAG: FAD-dependent oxidoreductase [Propionibacteriaceae bacterium]|nr:FAD-dependent oxidoreductase [Propionibacteriaceae bacterium]